MQIAIHLFAAAAEMAAARQVIVTVPDQATLEQVAEELGRLHPHMQALIAISRWAVDQQFSPLTATVGPSQEIALIPPVSGG